MAEVLSPFDLTPKKIGQIRGRVERNDGEATFVVHPLYRFLEITAGYLSQLQSVIARELKRDGLVLWFEEQHNPTLDIIPPITEGVVLNIPTKKGRPTTAYDPTVMDPSMEDEKIRESFLWDRVQELGVTRGRLAGRQLNYININEGEGINQFFTDWSALLRNSLDKPEAYKWLTRALYPYGCPASVAIECIGRGIDVSITKAISPGNIYPFDDPVIQRLMLPKLQKYH